MNVFVLDLDPYAAAEMHCDKHVVKMVIEYAQLLSAAHRLLDGVAQTYTDPRGKIHTVNVLPGERVSLITKMEQTDLIPQVEQFKLKRNPYRFVVDNSIVYGLTNANHQSAIWVRSSVGNYRWLAMLFEHLLAEYTHRFGRIHATSRLLSVLRNLPAHIPPGVMTRFSQALPEEYKHENVVEAYRRFYVGSEPESTKWTNREIPVWYQRAMEKQDATVFG